MTTTTTNVSNLSKKQQEVYDRLSAGQKPPEIAKVLKITTSGVYGHMRKMRAAGVELPGERMSNGVAPTAKPAEVKVKSVKSRPAVAPVSAPVGIEASIREALAAAEREVASLRAALAAYTKG